MAKIECLLCGGDVKIPKLSDTDKYEGDGVCEGCKSIIRVKLVKGKVHKYRIVKDKSMQKDRQYNILIQGKDAKDKLEKLLSGKMPELEAPEDTSIS